MRQRQKAKEKVKKIDAHREKEGDISGCAIIKGEVSSQKKLNNF
jgi:hypothetical protein